MNNEVPETLPACRQASLNFEPGTLNLEPGTLNLKPEYDGRK